MLYLLFDASDFYTLSWITLKKYRRIFCPSYFVPIFWFSDCSGLLLSGTIIFYFLELALVKSLLRYIADYWWYQKVMACGLLFWQLKLFLKTNKINLYISREIEFIWAALTWKLVSFAQSVIAVSNIKWDELIFNWVMLCNINYKNAQNEKL